MIHLLKHDLDFGFDCIEERLICAQNTDDFADIVESAILYGDEEAADKLAVCSFVLSASPEEVLDLRFQVNRLSMRRRC